MSERNFRKTELETEISNIVIASIGLTLVLTVAAMAAVFAVNNQFSALDRKFEATDCRICFCSILLSVLGNRAANERSEMVEKRWPTPLLLENPNWFASDWCVSEIW